MHPQISQKFRVIYGLPERPENLPESDFVQFEFGEGLRLRYLHEFWRLYRYLASHRSEIGLVHFYSTNLVLLGPVIARLAGVPAVSTLTGFGRLFSGGRSHLHLLRGLYWMLFGLSLRCSRQILLQNHGDLEALTLRYPRHASRLGYVGSTVSMSQVESKAFTDTPLVVILVARLREDKGIDDFVEVARHLAGSRIDFRLVGPASSGCSELLDRVRVAHDEGLIEYLGELDAQSTLQQLASAHILFFPSSYGEGLSRVILEAGFSCVYPIVYDIPSNRDLIRPGGGTMLAQGDIRGALDTIRALELDRERLSREAAAFQGWIAANYGPSAFARRIDEVYSRAMAR